MLRLSLGRRLAPLALGLLLASGCAHRPASTGFAPGISDVGPLVGEASYYGEEVGQRTASGERMDHDQLTAAHRTLPFGTRVRVTNLANGRSVVVTVNDRGPVSRRRILDVSRAAARRLGFIEDGTARVRLQIVRD